MTKLGVNIDHVATIRQARRAMEPNPVSAALLAELAGAHGITVHLRGDRRHINDRDVRLLRANVTTRLNIEMAVTEEMVGIALDIKPDMVTLVPENPEEITTEGGLDVVTFRNDIEKAVKKLVSAGIPVSLFVDPEPAQLEATVSVGADRIEINTAAYSTAVPAGLDEGSKPFHRELDKVVEAAHHAHALGLRVLAGHGLTYRNVTPISIIPVVEELNIGHNIISRAVLVGMEKAVREMLAAMNPWLGP